MSKQNSLIGRSITEVRQLSQAEIQQIFGETASQYDIPTLIKLDDGSELIPVRDPEVNGPGALLYFTPHDDEMLGDLLIPRTGESDTE